MYLVRDGAGPARRSLEPRGDGFAKALPDVLAGRAAVVGLRRPGYWHATRAGDCFGGRGGWGMFVMLLHCIAFKRVIGGPAIARRLLPRRT